MPRPVPNPTPQTGLRALRAIVQNRSVMPALSVFHAETGDIFRLSALNFSAIMMAGPAACKFVLADHADSFLWRLDSDPITELLIHGVLVEDGQSHDTIRKQLNPSLHKQMMTRYSAAMVRRTDQIIDTWAEGQCVDMLEESRKMALLILMDALFEVDYSPEMRRLWEAVIYLIKFISPGLWMFWRGVPRRGYVKYRAQMDDYLFQIIRLRRTELETTPNRDAVDMLSYLIRAEMPENLIRDQLMTMLIAGHDTSTALLAWVFYLLGQHPDALQKAQAEVDLLLGGQTPTAENTANLRWVDQCLDETLRLYPPIHLGSRTAAQDLEFQGVQIPKGARVLYSIYLTHRHPQHWDAPDDFKPERFNPGIKYDQYLYIPFGKGRRNCIGAVFAQVESRIVLARILQRVTFDATDAPKARLHMGATLEPRPGVFLTVKKRVS